MSGKALCRFLVINAMLAELFKMGNNQGEYGSERIAKEVGNVFIIHLRPQLATQRWQGGELFPPGPI